MGLLSGIFGKKHTNQETGEQHRTGLRKLFHAPGLEHAIRPIAKPLLPMVGSIAGGMFGGPLGAIGGGAIGGALSSKKHPLDHALGGAALGLGSAAFAPKLGTALGISPSSMAGKAFMMQHPALLHQLGIPGVSGELGGGLGIAQLMGRGKNSGQNGQHEIPQISGGGMPGGLGMKDLIDAGLFGVSVAGALGGRTKKSREPSINEIMEANRPKWGPQHQPRKVKPLNRRYIKPPPEHKAGFDPEWQFFEDEMTPPEYYAKGGYIKKGNSGGQDDDVEMALPEGAYVMNGMDVSLLGDGHSENGAKKLRQFEDKFLKSGIVNFRRGGSGQKIRAKVSNGEYIIRPEIVTALGRGSNRKGAKIIDRARLKLRKQKGVKKILPPRARPIEHYLG